MGLKVHLYLSPHLDDAILSCGGLIHRQRTEGEPVVVVTLCAGLPDYEQLSPFAQQYHRAWGNLPDPVASRRAEDRAVLTRCGATAYHFATWDSIYRRVGEEPAYSDLVALFSEPRPEELRALPRLWQEEIGRLGFDPAETVVYGPLAAGNHVDHQLARALALRLPEHGWHVWFYEDYPHVERSGALQEAKDWFGPVSWQARTVPIDVDARTTAISGYRTQLPFVFGDERMMVRRVRGYTAEVARDIDLVERIRHRLAGSGGRRERLWRTSLGYHSHAERIWRPTAWGL